MKQVTFTISDDLAHYISFLEKSHFILSKEDALSTALEFYKKLAMHEWLPFAYRMGGGRVILMDTVTILDFLQVLTNQEIYDTARISALKRKAINPFFMDVNFSQPESWSVVLAEMEIMGWGKFTRFRNTIQVESCGLPTLYLKGYFEGMFGHEFSFQQSDKIPNATIFVAKPRERKRS